MYRATRSFTCKDYDVKQREILPDDFTTQEEIEEYLEIGYIVVYDGSLEITENGIYDVKEYDTADVDVPSGEPNLQSKAVTITENLTASISPDLGYDGLNNVDVTVNVPSYEPNWSQIGYNYTPFPIMADFNESLTEYNNWDNTQTNLNNKFGAGNPIRYIPLVDTSNATDMSFFCNGNTRLEYVPELNTSNVTNMTRAFSGCTNLREISITNTSNVTSMAEMFKNHTQLMAVPEFDTQRVSSMADMFNTAYTQNKLEYVPQFNASYCINFQNMFNNCVNLAEHALDNILGMCANATRYNSASYYTKTLKHIGLTQAQAELCTTLNNWYAFINAGWTTGY